MRGAIGCPALSREANEVMSPAVPFETVIFNCGNGPAVLLPDDVDWPDGAVVLVERTAAGIILRLEEDGPAEEPARPPQPGQLPAQ
jgi:hypothetical protein